MAFDHELHEIDPATGFQRHKVSGHLIGIMQAPAARVSDETEYPKWVVPHIGHIKHHAQHGYITTPEWGEPHIDRATNEVKVLVHTREDEDRALADPGGMPDDAMPADWKADKDPVPPAV